MEKIGKYHVNVFAAKLPRMSDEEYKTLKESIRTQGLLHPIIVSDNDPLEIIEGANRARACIELGLDLKTVALNEYLDDSEERRESSWMTDETSGLRKARDENNYDEVIKEFIIMQNVIRRHLNTFTDYLQKTAITGKPKQGGDGSNQHRQKSKTAETAELLPKTSDIAEALGVSEKKVQQMNVIEAHAPAEIKNKLIAGDISVNKAYKETQKQMKPEKPKTIKEKKPDWFEQNIDDDEMIGLLKLLIQTTKKIERDFGLNRISDFRDLLNMNINHQNYKEKWNSRQD